MTKAKYAELPWANQGIYIHDAEGNVIAAATYGDLISLTQAMTHAQFIIRAVNNHDTLMEASQYALGFFRQFKDNLSSIPTSKTKTQRMDIINQHIKMLEQALANAKADS